MRYTIVATSEGRKELPKIIREVDEKGNIYVFTIHGKPKVAMVDFDLLDEFIENAEFGISEKEILKRSKEGRITFKRFKKKFDV